MSAVSPTAGNLDGVTGQARSEFCMRRSDAELVRYIRKAVTML